MDLLNMTNSSQIHDLQEIWDLLEGWKLATNAKFQHNISSIKPARSKKHRDMRRKYHYSNLRLLKKNTMASNFQFGSQC